MIYILLSNIEYDTEEEIKESYAHFIEENELELPLKEVENEKQIN